MIRYISSIISHSTQVMLLILVIGRMHNSLAQEVPMSQYYVSPLNMNPALAGSSTHPFVTVHHRSQWNTISDTYPINVASAIYPITQQYGNRINKGGLGLIGAREIAGVQGWLTHTEFRVAGAYNLPIDYRQQHVISFGVATGYLQRTIDPNQLQWGSQYDLSVGYNPSLTPSINVIRYRVGYASVQAGAVWSYNTFKNRLLSSWQWLSGLAISHMNRPDISFTDQVHRLPVMVKWHGGASYSKNNWKIHPQALVLWQQASYHVNVGAYAQYQVGYSASQQKTLLLGGLWYRWNDAVAVSSGLLHRNIQIAFSVDFSQYPTLNYASAGNAWEASIVYTIKHRKQTAQRRSIPLI